MRQMKRNETDMRIFWSTFSRTQPTWYYILKACLSSKGSYTMSQSSSRAQQNLREIGIGVFPVGVELTYLATRN